MPMNRITPNAMTATAAPAKTMITAINCSNVLMISYAVSKYLMIHAPIFH